MIQKKSLLSLLLLSCLVLSGGKKKQLDDLQLCVKGTEKVTCLAVEKHEIDRDDM